MPRSHEPLSEIERRALATLADGQRWVPNLLSVAVLDRDDEMEIHRLLDGLVRRGLAQIGLHTTLLRCAYWITDAGRKAQKRSTFVPTIVELRR